VPPLRRITPPRLAVQELGQLAGTLRIVRAFREAARETLAVLLLALAAILLGLCHITT
jgi:hypothetical protein